MIKAPKIVTALRKVHPDAMAIKFNRVAKTWDVMTDDGIMEITYSYALRDEGLELLSIIECEV